MSMRKRASREARTLSLRQVRKARPDEANVLSRLALRSKGHWGYDREFMDACREELTLSAELIRTGQVYLVEEHGRPAGFYSLARWNADLELCHFFVDPAAMGRGLGRLLWSDAVDRGRALGHKRLLIQSDPHAEGFYLRLGAERIGDVPSGVRAGRKLPLLLYSLDDGQLGPAAG